ncbi:MAG: TROVE domain-containing protein, partial [Myxococcota bacterium]
AGAPGSLLDAVEDCLMASLGNLPRFGGRVMSLCDNSGSARGTTTSSMGTMQIATIANLTAVLTGMVSDEGHVGVFGDRLETFSVRAKSSVFDQLQKAERLGQRIGAGTENGVWLFWDRAIRERQHWDSVFVYSDMQAGHGGLYGTDVKQYADYVWGGKGHYIDVPKLISAYRAQVNPKVQVFLVQVAGYQDTIVPEIYDRTYILGGWGDGLLRWAASMVEMSQS